MSISVTFNGVAYTIPSPGEVEWSTSLNAFLTALAGALGNQGGSISVSSGNALSVSTAGVTGVKAIEGTASGSNGIGVKGTANASGGIGVYGHSDAGYGVLAEGDTTSPATSALRVVPQNAQPSGPNLVGDMYATTAGVLKICTVAGTPGTWVSVGAQT